MESDVRRTLHTYISHSIRSDIMGGTVGVAWVSETPKPSSQITFQIVIKV